MSTAALRPTPEDCSAFGLAALPTQALVILQAEQAPPRLVAHLALVHDVALQLITALQSGIPGLSFDADAVAFGAATHDIGKARVRAELSEPGKDHERLGERLLLEHAVPADFARFARTHGSPAPALPLEDICVIVADTVWKAKRTKEIDDLLVAEVSLRTGAPAWQCFSKVDRILQRLAAGSSRRLEWQMRHPTT